MQRISWLRVKQGWPVVLFLALLIGLALIPTPTADRGGSTYSRDPNGYGAWYAYMQERGTPVQRWRKPLQEWEAWAKSRPKPPTLVQIYGRPVESVSSVPAGTHLITVGVKTPATLAPYETHHQTPAGMVHLATSRRLSRKSLPPGGEALLADSFGVIAWQEPVPDADHSLQLFINSPDFAANAYQDDRGNYEFLAQLATAGGGEVWVDEYLHGYREVPPHKNRRQSPQSWQSYLQHSPVILVLIQGGILLLCLIFSQNQRFGPRLPLGMPTPENTIAYVEALAAVLRKVNNHQFVGDTLGKAEQEALKRRLGLGGQALTQGELIQAWSQYTGRSPQEVAAIVKFPKPCGDAELRQWLQQIATLRDPDHNADRP